MTAKRRPPARPTRMQAPRRQPKPTQMPPRPARRQNPPPDWRAIVARVVRRVRRRNPDDYPTAARASETFHGGIDDVVSLGPKERQRGRWKTVVGTLEEVAYRVPRNSQRARGGSDYEHEVGDRGTLRPRAKRKPLLVADAKTGKLEIVGGEMKFDPRRGIVG